MQITVKLDDSEFEALEDVAKALDMSINEAAAHAIVDYDRKIRCNELTNYYGKESIERYRSIAGKLSET